MARLVSDAACGRMINGACSNFTDVPTVCLVATFDLLLLCPNGGPSRSSDKLRSLDPNYRRRFRSDGVSRTLFNTTGESFKFLCKKKKKKTTEDIYNFERAVLLAPAPLPFPATRVSRLCALRFLVALTMSGETRMRNAVYLSNYVTRMFEKKFVNAGH